MFSAFNTFGRMGAPAGRTLAQQIAAMLPKLWLEPSVTNGYQDSAGTTALTQPGGGSADPPVGLALDLSGNGRNASQSTSTARPKLSARVNLLTYTEDFSNASWAKTSATISANAITGPDGTLTADKIVASAATSAHVVNKSVSTTDTLFTHSAYLKAGEYTFAAISATEPGVKDNYTFFDLINGVVGQNASGNTASITSVGNGWFRCTVTRNHINTYSQVQITIAAAASDGVLSFLGDGASGIYVWGAQLELGSTATAYQAVTDANNYAYAGFPLYWKFDGTDDWLATGNIDLTGTDKVTVVAGVMKASDYSSYSMVAEFSADSSSVAGSFALMAPWNSGLKGFGFDAGGTTRVHSTNDNHPAPINAVLTGTSNISAPSARLDFNGADGSAITTSQGAGNYSNSALNIGRRAGGTLAFNGNIYALLIFPRILTAAEIAIVERYVAQKSGVTL